MSEQSKKKRFDRALILQRRLKNFGETVWSDEKWFSVEPVISRRTGGVYAKDHSTIPDIFRYVSRRQKPAGVMVWAAVTTSGKKSPLVFVKERVKINSAVLECYNKRSCHG